MTDSVATIYDVAKLARVSTYTVSCVVNKSAYVSPELTERVLHAVRKLDYTPNAVARSLQTRTTKTVGMLIPDIANPFYAKVVRGVEDRLSKDGYSLLLGNTYNAHDAQSRSAARDVLRYFDLAAPLHHQDEELHIFPRLEGAADSALTDAVARLRADHVQMESLWAQLRRVLQSWTGEAVGTAPDEPARQLAAAFAGLYEQHLALEEALVFPAARGGIDEAGLTSMSRDMARRRTGTAAR